MLARLPYTLLLLCVFLHNCEAKYRLTLFMHLVGDFEVVPKALLSLTILT